ncbi:MAG: BON domain-containing protein [bacterium]
MRTSSLIATVLAVVFVSGCMGGVAATKKMDESIRAGTDMGLDNAVKSRDLAVESQIMQGIASDPGLVMVKDKIQVVVSHNVVEVTGKIKTEEQKATIEAIVKNAVATANVKKYELDLEIDPSIEDPPFEW